MAPRSRRFNHRVLTVFLIVGLPALAMTSILALGVGQGRLRASYAEHLAEVAEQAASSVDSFVFRRIVQASVLGRIPLLRETASTASRDTLNPEAVRKLDAEWQRAGAIPPGLAGLLDSPTSSFLADAVAHDPIYREILLTDLNGRIVATSNLTSDYLQSDELWWREAFGDGVRGRVSVGDVQWDESARAFVVDIAVPVPAPGSDRLGGILKISADIREMGTIIDGVRLGTTGDAVLVRGDGSIVLSRRKLDPDARFFAADLLRERYDVVRKGDPEYRVTFSARGADGGSRLVAVAPSQLSASYPNLAWLVAVSQAESELLAPIRAQMWLLLVAIAVTAAAVLALALWFSMRLAAGPLDGAPEMNLVEHSTVPRLEEPA